MWFVFKTLQTSSSVVYVSVTSKPVWQKQNPSDQWVDMTDYVLCVSSGVLGVVHTETLAPRGKLKNTKNSCLFCVCFVFLRRMSGFFFFLMWPTRWGGSLKVRECACGKADTIWMPCLCTLLRTEATEMPGDGPRLGHKLANVFTVVS